MDSEHRHELKESDLANFLAKTGSLWKRHGLKAMVVVLVALLAILITRASHQRKLALHDQTWSALGTATTPKELLDRVGQFEDPTARALAYLSVASAYNASAALPDATRDDGGHREKSLGQASNMVDELLNSDDVPDLIHLNALLLAAAIEENRGNFDAATERYNQVLAHGTIKNEPAIAQRARFRLAFIPTLQTPQPFGAEPVQDNTPAVPGEAVSAPPAPVDSPTESDEDGS